MKSLRLKESGALRIENGAGMVVEVTRGQVWLTQERDPRDYYLRAGDWLRIDASGSVVVSAVGEEAWIDLTALRPINWAGRVARMFQMLSLTRAAASS